MGLKNGGLRGSLRNIGTDVSVIPDSVVARFKFEQSLTDSVNGYDASHSATPAYSTDAQEGIYSLDKPDTDIVTVPYDVDETSFSWIGWVKWSTEGTWIDNRDGNFDGAGRVSLSSGTIDARSDDWGGSSLTVSGTTGTWTHLVYQYSNGTAELFKDGSLVDTISPSDPNPGRPDFYIGLSGGSIEGSSSVLTDDVMLADAPLTSDEISNIYSQY